MRIFGNKIILALIILCQVALVLFWGGKKENLYWDEYYSLERANYVSDSTPGDHYFSDDEEYHVNRWTDLSIVADTLRVSGEEGVFHDTFASTVKKLFGVNSYSVLLNYVSAVFFENKISVWPAIILNAILLVIHQLLLFSLAKIIINNDFFATAVVAFYGFSRMCLSMAVFVRFYVLAALMITIFTYFHMKYWDCDNDKRIKKYLYLAAALFSVYIGYNNAQFTVFYAAFMIISFSVMLLLRKGVIPFLEYSIPLLFGGILYAVKNGFIDIMLHPVETYNALDGGGAMGWFIGQIMSFHMKYVPDRCMEMINLISRYMFGSRWTFLLFIILLAVAVIIKIRDEKAFHFDLLKNDQVMIIALSVILMVAFFTCFKLYEQPRYISYIFPELAIVIMALIYYAVNKELLKKGFIIMLLLTEVLIVNIKGNVDMIYQGDQEQIKRIRDTGIGSFFLNSYSDHPFIIYQTVLLGGDDAEFYDYDSEEKYAADDFRDRMLVVIQDNLENDEILRMLKRKGYSLNPVGNTYFFTVYEADRNEYRGSAVN